MRSIVPRTIASIPVAAVAVVSAYAAVAIVRSQPPEPFTVILVIAIIGLLQLAVGLAVGLLLAWLRPSSYSAATAAAVVTSLVFLFTTIVGCFDSGMIDTFEAAGIIVLALVLAVCCGLVSFVATSGEAFI